MTTAQSPLHVLQAQADRIATALKAAERGEKIASDPGGSMAVARGRETITFAVVMDDRVLKIEMPWTTVRDTSEAGIAEYILKQMRDSRDAIN